jgi:NitT/TauT family transport system ATP-binding protein
MGRGPEVTLLATRPDARFDMGPGNAAAADAGAVAAPSSAIRIERVAKTFDGRRGRVRALDAVDFEVPAGQFVSILGPSGCGKSTLLRIVAGLTAPDAGGRVEVLGRQHAGVPEDLGVVFQTHNMLPWETVERNLRLAAEVRGLPRAEIDTRVTQMLDVLGLAGFRTAYPHELSGGMRQRAALGQILVLRPQILLLDEPFGALDALTRDQLNVELLRLWQELRKTVLLITHSIAEAVFLSDRIIVMSERPGRVLEDIVIDMPRPRDPRRTKQAVEFGRYVVRLGQLMGVQ